MPVSIPRLQQINPITPTGGGERIRGQAQDSAQNILSTTQAIGGLANEAADLYQEFENDKIKQLSYEAEKDYTTWNNEQLQKLRSYEGDPTDAYAQYELDSKEKYDEILNARPDLSERAKRHLSSNLGRVTESQRIQALKQRGAQVETYENNLFESTVKLRKNNLAVNAGYIRPDDQGSFLPFDENIADIKTVIAKRGMDKGTATRLPDDAKTWNHMYRDEDGNMVKVQLSDIAKQRVAQELSQGVSESVNTLLASGYNEEAKTVFEKYQGYIDPKNKVSLQNKFKTNDVKDEAYQLVNKIDTVPPERQLEEIEKISDPQVRDEVLKIKDAMDRRRENLRERKHKTNYNTLSSHVFEKMNSNQPYFGIADLENDPLFKQTWDNLDVKGKKAITEMIEQPKETNSKSEVRVQNLFFGLEQDKSIETVTPEEFNEYLTGLSKSDRTKYTNMFNRMRVQTAGQERATYKRAESLLEDQLLLDKHITRDKFGKISGKNEIKLIEARNNLIDHLSSEYGAFTEKDLKDYIKQYSASIVKREVFNPEPRRVFNSRNENQQTRTTANEVQLSPRDLTAMKRRFRAENGYFPTTDDEKFKNFVQRNR